MKGFLQRQLQALLLAIQFLTVLPVPRHSRNSDKIAGASILWYPAVGLVIGVILLFVSHLLSVPAYLHAGLLLALWVVLSGGLHLDGFADCVDAWAGGLGDRERTLQLLRDPLCGSMAVIALNILLLLKYLALVALLQGGALVALWLVPVLSRASLLLLFMSTDYVRAGGLGERIAQQFSSKAALWVVAALAIVLFVVLPVDTWGVLLVTMSVVFLLVRHTAIERLGGFTGDVAGALVELVELSLLLALTFFFAVD